MQTYGGLVVLASVCVSPWESYLVGGILLISSISPMVFHPTLLRIFLISKGKDLMETSNLDSLSKYIWLWVSIPSSICYGRNFLWWWLDKAPIYEYSRILLGIILLTFLPVIIGILGLWVIPLLVPGPLGSARGRFFLIAWAQAGPGWPLPQLLCHLYPSWRQDRL